MAFAGVFPVKNEPRINKLYDNLKIIEKPVLTWSHIFTPLNTPASAYVTLMKAYEENTLHTIPASCIDKVIPFLSLDLIKTLYKKDLLKTHHVDELVMMGNVTALQWLVENGGLYLFSDKVHDIAAYANQMGTLVYLDSFILYRGELNTFFYSIINGNVPMLKHIFNSPYSSVTNWTSIPDDILKYVILHNDIKMFSELRDMNGHYDTRFVGPTDANLALSLVHAPEIFEVLTQYLECDKKLPAFMAFLILEQFHKNYFKLKDFIVRDKIDYAEFDEKTNEPLSVHTPKGQMIMGPYTDKYARNQDILLFALSLLEQNAFILGSLVKHMKDHLFKGGTKATEFKEFVNNNSFAQASDSEIDSFLNDPINMNAPDMRRHAFLAKDARLWRTILSMNDPMVMKLVLEVLGQKCADISIRTESKRCVVVK